MVDGLDECTNEAAGRVAIQPLAVFVLQRNIPAVVTSRPRGFQRLGVEEIGWQVGELADFSLEQQVQLARCWFMYWIMSTTTVNIDDDAAERQVRLSVQGFLADLRRSPDLRDLAKVPLLLCLLIYLRMQIQY